MSNSFMVAAPAGSNIPPIEAGTYYAVCTAIIDLGEQYNKLYDNYSRKCVFQFEIPDEYIEIDGEMKPRVISETFTASLGIKAKLRGALESWRGKPFTDEELQGFDLQNVLGAACLLNIIHNETNAGNVFAKIAAITRLPKGAVVSTETKPKLFSLSSVDALAEVETLPEWMQERIKESPTYKELLNASMTVEESDEDLPF